MIESGSYIQSISKSKSFSSSKDKSIGNIRNSKAGITKIVKKSPEEGATKNSNSSINNRAKMQI